MSFSGLWKRTKRRFGAVNSPRLWITFNRWCARSLYALPWLQSDAGAECPPYRGSFSGLSVPDAITPLLMRGSDIRPRTALGGPLKNETLKHKAE